MGRLLDEIVTDLKAIGADFRINDLNEAIECRFKGPEWGLLDDTLEAVIRTELREMGYGIKGQDKANRTAVSEGWITLAHQQRYNPIHAYFQRLRKTPYTPNVNGGPLPAPVTIEGMQIYFDNPDGYAARWLFRWMTGAIAKVFTQERNPMLVLSGSQNCGKSTFIRWLCPPELREFFREGAIRPDVKDERLRLVDTFMQEVPELGSTTRRADVEAFKDFITRKSIVDRPPYGSRPIKKPAICSFIGSVNFDGAGFLVDTTGNTRFLVTEINGFDFSYSNLDVTALWREALWFYDNYQRIWELSPAEKEAQAAINKQFEMVNALEDVVMHHLTITGAPGDFETTLKIRDRLAPHYRYTTEQAFNRELSKTLKAMGGIPGRMAYKDGGPHHRGWYGVKINE